jgi:hypothetical protein
LIASVSCGPVQQLDLHLVKGTHCLDGTPAGYYHGASPSNTSSRWVVFFEGGGACYSLDSCAARATTTLGSSAKWAQNYSQNDNLLSADPAVNPVFYDAHKIYIPYCTGDVHGGTRSAPLNASWPFFFSGHGNVVTIIHELATAHFSSGGDAATPAHLLVTGSSAGGLGTLLNADYIADVLGASAIVTAAPQAGWFFPPVSLYPIWAAGGDAPVWTTLGFVSELWASYSPPACLAAHNASFCASAANLAPFLRAPMLLAENLVDSNQVFQELLAPPNAPRLPAFEAYFHAAMQATLRAVAVARPDWAVWAPACVAHTENIRLDDPAVTNGTTVNGVSYRDALTTWVTGAGNAPRVLIDQCVDPLPCNPSCPKAGAGQ